MMMTLMTVMMVIICARGYFSCSIAELPPQSSENKSREFCLYMTIILKVMMTAYMTRMLTMTTAMAMIIYARVIFRFRLRNCPRRAPKRNRGSFVFTCQ